MWEEVSYTKKRNLKPKQTASLADCTFIDRVDNILINGATGSGKVSLHVSLSFNVCLILKKIYTFGQ